MPFSTLICCNTATWQGQFCWDDIPSWNLIFDKAALSCDLVCVHIYAHTHTYKQPPLLALWWIISLFFFHCTLHDFANEHVSLLSLYAFAEVVSEWCYTLITQVETSQACGTAALWVPLKMMSATVGTVLLCAVLWGHSVIFLTTKIYFFLCRSETTLTVECVLNKSLPSSARQPRTAAMSGFEQSLA